WEAWWISLPLLMAEIYGYVGGLLFIVGLWRPLVRQVRSLSQLMPAMPRPHWPTVDVFITCYNEPADLVEKTVRAALAMDYPADKLRVYILDDGNAPAMRTMAEQLCLEDLQSPELQRLSQDLQVERQRLVQKQDELKAARLDLQKLDTGTAAPLEPYRQLIQRVTMLLNPAQQNVEQQISAAIAQLKQSIHHQELALTDLARCRYIARPKPAGRPHHAKAGNINYAMFSGKTTGEFILTLDADHIPKPQFLQRVLPYFFDYNLRKGWYEANTIAFVQTPQHFYNLPDDDPFGHRAQLFYGPIQQGKDGLNSAFYTGTNAVLRREALVTTGLQNFAQ
ncbi:MAG: glycosyltransferase, partial [Cyanobacteria bacterium P01_D01_bin.2]